MPIPYLENLSWNDLTREERFYCFVLYSHAARSPNRFAKWVSDCAKLPLDPIADWDVGVEVCLYRDVLWHRDDRVRSSGLSPKRTFDLCLFGPHDVVVIEAKVFEPFGVRQTDVFKKDVKRIPKLLAPNTPNVVLVSLASSKYYKPTGGHGPGKVLQSFSGHLSWAQAFEEYQDPLLQQADQLYRSRIRKLTKPTGQQSRGKGVRTAGARNATLR